MQKLCKEGVALNNIMLILIKTMTSKSSSHICAIRCDTRFTPGKNHHICTCGSTLPVLPCCGFWFRAVLCSSPISSLCHHSQGDSCKILKPHQQWIENTSKNFQSEVMYWKSQNFKKTNKQQILRNVSMLTGFGFCKNSKWQTGTWRHISQICCDIAHIDFLWPLFTLFLTATTNTCQLWGDQKYSSLSSMKKQIFLCTVYISLTLILTPTGQDARFQGDYLFCFWFSLFAPNTWMKVHFIPFLIIWWTQFKTFALHKDGDQALDRDPLQCSQWLSCMRLVSGVFWSLSDTTLCWCNLRWTH